MVASSVSLPAVPRLHACSICTIPGFTYPVLEKYLEDVFEMTGYTVSRNSR